MPAESNSIANQRILLRQYAQKLGVDICAEFVDDGESGTKWERTGLQEMLTAIRDGLVTTVLVKDLSRLSRDYIRTGELLEKWFPAHHVRFISVDDGIDTAASSAVSDFAAIRAVMDDWYARDISRKVRAAVYSRQQAGFCTSASLPFGYQKANNCIQIRSDHAETVRCIFAAYRAGKSCNNIAKILNDMQIPGPRASTSGWSGAEIRLILKNPAYTGRLHLHTTQKVSHKGTLRYRLSESEHIIYPVPQIISDADFTEVQHILSKNSHTQHSRHWLSGKAVCGICGSIMTVTSGNEDHRLICGGRKRRNGCCNPSLLMGLLLSQLESELAAVGLPNDEVSLKRLIRSLHITPEQVTVSLICQKPRTRN